MAYLKVAERGDPKSTHHEEEKYYTLCGGRVQ